MKTFQKAIAGFLLCVGFAIIGLSVLDLVNLKKTAREKQRAMATLIVFGCVPVGVGGYMISARLDRAQRQEQGRLRAIFFRLVRAGQGCITVSDFVAETGLSPEDAQTYLEDRASSFSATRQVDDKENVSYVFQLGYADPKRLLEEADDKPSTYSLLLRSVPSDREEEVLKVLQELIKVEPEAIKEVLNEPLLPIQIGMTRAIALDHRKRLEEAGATVLVVLE